MKQGSMTPGASAELVTLRCSREPRGLAYQELISWGTAAFPRALLVRRPDLDLSAKGHAVLRELEPFVSERRSASIWPGTELLDEEAELICFSLAPPVAAILRKAAGGLFGWRQPELPEDLAFLRSSGEPALTTVSHEGEAFLTLTEWEAKRWERAAPATVGLFAR